MKPAFSVLFFTVCAGAGTGLLIWLLLIQLMQGWVLGRTLQHHQLLFGGGIGLVLVSLGLLSSTLHLANPRNAWKAFNRFRTSWLSREGVFSLLFYPLFLSYAAALHFNDYQMNGLAIILGTVAVVMALATVYCTGMIYASLKPIRQWHNNLTTPLYLVFALMSGGVLMLALHVALYGQVSNLLAQICIALLIISAVLKWLYFWFIGKPKGETISTATGFDTQTVRLLDAGHSANTFLSNEFVYNAAPEMLSRLRKMVAVFAFVLPLVLVMLSMLDGFQNLTYFCVASVMVGLLVERWLFFAEARHVVRLYHGDQCT